MIDNELNTKEELELAKDATSEQEIQQEQTEQEIQHEASLAEAEEPIAVEKEHTVVVEEIVKPVNIYSLENFDWDAIGKKHENYSSAERTKLEGRRPGAARAGWRRDTAGRGQGQ